MPESRKKHFNIDGAQEKDGDDEQTGTFRPIPQGDGDFRTSRSSIGKSREKVSDGAEEKLLKDSDDVKISTRVSMTDAKYVVGDHRNGDAKIELDANKRQFSGLTKEELLKYKDDPFWVRLRWALFVLFWLLWLCMLAGAITIIVRAPKCAAPTPKTWAERGPLADMSESSYSEIDSKLPILKSSNIEGVFVSAEDTYKVLDDPSAVESFKKLAAKAKELGIKLIVDLLPNFVSTGHRWFALSENRSAEFDSYFVWADGRGYDADGKPLPPSNWVSRLNASSWQFSAARGQFFLQQHGAGTADLNFTNAAVVSKVDEVLKAWMHAGAAGVRLRDGRSLLVTRLADGSFPPEPAAGGAGGGAVHTDYLHYNHPYTVDHEKLDELLPHWSQLVKASAEDGVTPVFTLYEDGSRPPLHYLSRSPALLSALHPPSDTVALRTDNLDKLRDSLKYWPALKLQSSEAGGEAALFAMLLPAAPVLDATQIVAEQNDTHKSESMSHLVSLRADPSVAHGEWEILTVGDNNSTETLIAINRWKPKHTGYVAVYNPGAEGASAALRLAGSFAVHHVSRETHERTNYTTNTVLQGDNIFVPARSTVVLSYVPKSSAEQ